MEAQSEIQSASEFRNSEPRQTSQTAALYQIPGQRDKAQRAEDTDPGTGELHVVQAFVPAQH